MELWPVQTTLTGVVFWETKLLPSSPWVTLTLFTTVPLPDEVLGAFFLIFAAKVTPVGKKSMVFERMCIESRGRKAERKRRVNPGPRFQAGSGSPGVTALTQDKKGPP